MATQSPRKPRAVMGANDTKSASSREREETHARTLKKRLIKSRWHAIRPWHDILAPLVYGEIQVAPLGASWAAFCASPRSFAVLPLRFASPLAGQNSMPPQISP